MKKILIIGCEENVRHQYKKNLQDLGYHIILGYSLEDGESKIREEKPDLIALDIQTPKTDDIQFLEKCRKEHQDGA